MAAAAVAVATRKRMMMRVKQCRVVSTIPVVADWNRD